ncbi:NAD(P)/FAD-dependent oxidoreductase [Nocardia sp. NPDC020380]|uniref:NAD(P)/FAD-dependent oxidoreductase n=1 Tax=Nocardia sp. NPDC020380 TaxID=3364309 RepID=UPI0037BD3A98
MTGSVAIVGASLAGLSALRALRACGFRGHITLIGEEPHLPYDRPALSKEFLHSGEPLPLLEDHSEATELDAEWLLGRRAIGLTTCPHTIHLDDGRTVTADTVILATGARPRRLSTFPEAHYLRSLDDARQLRENLTGTTHLAVAGAGFIGAEIASSAQAMGVQVTLVDPSPTPGAHALGPVVAAACNALHAHHGVRLRTGVSIATHIPATTHPVPTPGMVRLTDGTTLRADTLLVGIGSTPNTEWAVPPSGNPSPPEPWCTTTGFATDTLCRTTTPGIYAIGDCAHSPDPLTARPTRTEHWTAATTQARLAAAIITGTPAPAPTAPYFWSRQYGKLLQLAGNPHAAGNVRLLEGSYEAPSFTVLYERAGVPVAVFALDNPRLFTRHRKQLDRTLRSDLEIA